MIWDEYNRNMDFHALPVQNGKRILITCNP